MLPLTLETYIKAEGWNRTNNATIAIRIRTARVIIPLYHFSLLLHIFGLKDGNRTHNNWSHNPAPLPVGLPPTKNGVPTGIRTQAPLIKSQVLYLLSYRHIYYTSKFMTLRSITLLQNFVFVNNTQCQRRDSNPLKTITGISMELQSRIELPTSSLPMKCATYCAM